MESPLQYESNTAFSHILLSLDLMESDDQNPEHSSYYQIIRDNLARLKELISSTSEKLRGNIKDK